ncbi:hypothetical protein EBU94_04030 [bacterium]|nr:hypothetical protein [bacterium]
MVSFIFILVTSVSISVALTYLFFLKREERIISENMDLQKKQSSFNEEILKIVKDSDKLAEKRRAEGNVYYRAVCKSISYLDQEQFEQVLDILKESETFRKLYDLQNNRYKNPNGIHIDKEVFNSTIDSLKKNLN